MAADAIAWLQSRTHLLLDKYRRLDDKKFGPRSSDAKRRATSRFRPYGWVRAAVCEELAAPT